MLKIFLLLCVLSFIAASHIYAVPISLQMYTKKIGDVTKKVGLIGVVHLPIPGSSSCSGEGRGNDPEEYNRIPSEILRKLQGLEGDLHGTLAAIGSVDVFTESAERMAPEFLT